MVGVTPLFATSCKPDETPAQTLKVDNWEDNYTIHALLTDTNAALTFDLVTNGDSKNIEYGVLPAECVTTNDPLIFNLEGKTLSWNLSSVGQNITSGDDYTLEFHFYIKNSMQEVTKSLRLVFNSILRVSGSREISVANNDLSDVSPLLGVLCYYWNGVKVTSPAVATVQFKSFVSVKARNSEHDNALGKVTPTMDIAGDGRTNIAWSGTNIPDDVYTITFMPFVFDGYNYGTMVQFKLDLFSI